MGSLGAMCQRQPQPLPFSSSQGHHQQQRRKNLAPLAGTWTVQPLLALLLLAATPACVHHASARVHDHSLVLPAELSASLGLSSSGETQGGLLKTGVQRRAAAGEALVQGGGSEGQGYERALQASGKAKAAAGSGAAGGRTAAGAAKDGYSALCVVGKNENRYVREWVEYHKCLGERPGKHGGKHGARAGGEQWWWAGSGRKGRSSIPACTARMTLAWGCRLVSTSWAVGNPASLGKLEGCPQAAEGPLIGWLAYRSYCERHLVPLP